LHCKGIRNIINRKHVDSNLEFSLLDYHFPNSEENFNMKLLEFIE